MKLKMIVAAAGLACLTGCQQKKEASAEGVSVIDIAVHEDAVSCSLSEIADYSCVILPTSDSLLLGGEITRIRLSGDRLYVSDGTLLCQVDTAGNDLRIIQRKGEGPEEYHAIRDFIIDNDRAWIDCWNTRTLKCYDWNNRMIQKIDIGMWVQSIHKEKGNFYLYTGNNSLGENDNCQLYVLNPESGQLEQHFKPIDPVKAKYLFTIDGNNFMQMYDQSLYFTQLFNDTIYSLTPTALQPRYVLNFDGQNIPASFFNRNYTDIADFFTQLHKEGRFAYGTDLFIDTGQTYWASYFYQKECNLSVIPKDNPQKQVRITTLKIDQLFDYPVQLTETPIFASGNGTVTILLQPAEIMEYAEQHLSAEQQEALKQRIHFIEDQNPILLLVRPF